DYNSLIWVFNQLFQKVEATKPPSSRNVSAEIFVVCQDYIAPKKIDPRFLDPKYVFEDLVLNKTQTSIDIFAPEPKKKRRHREGYEEGEYTQHKQIDAMEFIKSRDPVGTLGSANEMIFTSEEGLEIAKLPETTEDILLACKDLKVLGKKDFRVLMKWRAGLRERFQLEKAEEQPKIESDNGDGSDVEGELDVLVAREAKRLRKERRRVNAKRQKQLVNMHMNMTTPADIGMEQDGGEEIFQASAVVKAKGAAGLDQLNESDMGAIDVDKDLADEALVRLGARPVHSDDDDSDVEDSRYEAVDSDDESARLERLEQEMDVMYSEFVERKRERDSKYDIKKKRAAEDEFHGFGDDGNASGDGSGSGSNVESDAGSDSDSAESGDDEDIRSMMQAAKESKKQKAQAKNSVVLAGRAAMWFDQPVFKGVGVGLDDVTDDESNSSAMDIDSESEMPIVDGRKRKHQAVDDAGSEIDSDDSFEVTLGDEDEGDPNDVELKDEERQADFDLATPEAMTMVRDLVNRKTTKDGLIDKHFNRRAFNETEGLPEWFVDDESLHSKTSLPVSKEAVRMMREKLKALDARPIKKVAEAMARKKMRAAKNIAKIHKKAESVIANDEMTEAEKARSINRMVNRATKAKPKEKVTLVVARNGNRGVQGRPKGVKGRYRMVDPRMKADLRAVKAREKRKKKGGRK
ncbi:AdoMet-dependent rRNA methyltransferase spb1, partial [Coemansia sp. RSA 1938]